MKIFNVPLFLFMCSIFLCACGTEKSDILAKNWKATELTLGQTKLLADDLGGISFNFQADSTFVYTETGKTDNGKWTLNEKDSTIILTYKEDNRTVIQDIKEFSSGKLVLDYEDHGMKRTVTLVPVVK